VNCLAHLVKGSETEADFVQQEILEAGLSWAAAKEAFSVKFGSICAEEQALTKLFSLRSADFTTTSAFLAAIVLCLKTAGVPHDQFVFVTFAMCFMNPAVAALIRFGKKVRHKMSWPELEAAARDQEYNIANGAAAPSFGKNKKQPPENRPAAALETQEIKQDDPDKASRREQRQVEWEKTRTCHTCGEKGHISTSCPKKAPSVSPIQYPKSPVPPPGATAQAPRTQGQFLAGVASGPAALEVDSALRELCGLPVVGGTMPVVGQLMVDAK
jgi:hypothetical protein